MDIQHLPDQKKKGILWPQNNPAREKQWQKLIIVFYVLIYAECMLIE